MGEANRTTDRTGRRYADAALALLLMAIVGMMIVPLPTPLLDVLIASNLSLGLLMLLIAMTVSDGLAFAAMPTVLLMTTLYRLALNVSSTRLILLQADAGEVIRAFGEFVVRGNYVVGGVVFAILTLIQYVVVARGSERVAEVGARFSLDAMPGKQMAIDADLRAGVLTPEGARKRRLELDRHNQFYGAMDGAMKFVKGDAIAGIGITLINLSAGVGIGVGMHDLSAMESLQLYGLLTIGDGLVSQIPSLLTSTAAGLVVTRVASQEPASSLGSDITHQMFGDPRVLAFGSAFLGALALVPGLPLLPFGTLALLLASAAYTLHRIARARRPNELEAAAAAHTQAEPTETTRVAVALGSALAARLYRDERQLASALAEARERSERETGVPIPAIAVRHDARLPDDEFRLLVDGLPLSGGHGAGDLAEVTQTLEYELRSLLRRHASEWVGIQETQQLLERLAERAPALVQHAVPKPISLITLTRVLQGLLAEGISIQPLREILEALCESPDGDADPAELVESVRNRMRRRVTATYAADGCLRVHALDALIEETVREAVARDERGRFLALPPAEANEILAAVARLRAEHGADPTVLVTQPDIRRFVRQLLASEQPEVAVLSYPELTGAPRVERGTPLRIGGAAAS